MSTSCLKICRCEVSGPAPEKQRMSSLALGFYKLFISPVLYAITPSQCKFLPTCSEYAYIALSRFGVIQGSRLALRRVLRCHPWAKGGVDPVPDFEAH